MTNVEFNNRNLCDTCKYNMYNRQCALYHYPECFGKIRSNKLYIYNVKMCCLYKERENNGDVSIQEQGWEKST